jgi:CRP-like cAMP-binding protein/tRNA A-37 threonylcarbamoyl transferase component Bud32
VHSQSLIIFLANESISQDDWDDEEVCASAREYHTNSAKIIKRESTIAENVRRREERRHRLTVFARQIDATECPLSSPKSEKERAFLKKVLCEDRKFIFCDFSEKERQFMLDVIRKDDTVKKGDILYSVGDVGSIFYIIEEGQVEILEEHDTGGDITIETLRNGDSFGEVALLFDAPRTATARARTDCVLWTMHQQCFRAKLAHHALSQEEEMIGLLRRVELFANLDDVALRKFANALEQINFAAGERIVNKGDVGNVFYIIEKGDVLIHGIGAGDSQYVDVILKTGEWFGERSLLTGEPRSAHATAKTDVTAWAVDRQTFETSFGPLKDVMQHQMKKNFLTAIPVFAESNLNPSEFDQLAGMMQELSLRAGYPLDEVGKPYRQELVVIGHGRVNVYDGKREDGGKVFTLKNGDYYGDKHLRDFPPKDSCYNVICEENTTVWIIGRDDIISVIGDFERLGESVSFQVQRRVSMYAKKIGQKDVNKVRVLGHGGFGKVWLVKHKVTGAHYALKELNKRKIIDRKQIKNVLREKEILATLNHPFILSEVSSFQDEASLFILMDLIQGGELYQVIVNTNGMGLPLRDAVFYGACVMTALSHFHARLICYRDLKPENVMVGADGYCVVVDLGFAKVVTTKTFTLCGTPEYLVSFVVSSLNAACRAS